MATIAASRPRTANVASPGILIPAYTLWLREIVRFYRQKARVVGVIASPLLFWVVLGSGFAHSFSSNGSGSSSGHYMAYFFPGAVVMIVLFTAIFSMMSLITDRNEGFLLSVLAAPVSRSSIVLGKVLGGATLAAIQGIVFLVFGPLVGASMTPEAIGMSVLVIVLISFELTALGFAIAWPMDSTQAFHAIINLLLIPLWLGSGALFPRQWSFRLAAFLHAAQSVDLWRRGVARQPLPQSSTAFNMTVNLAVTAVFCVLTFAVSWAIVNRRSNRPAA